MPLLDSPEDLAFIEAESHSLKTLVFLGAQVRQDAGKNYYAWTDGLKMNFLTKLKRTVTNRIEFNSLYSDLDEYVTYSRHGNNNKDKEK